MNKVSQAILLVAMVLIMVSCATEPERAMSPRGFEYIKHVSSGGEMIKPGEYAYFNIVMRHKDSVINSSYGEADMPRIRIPNPEEYTDQTPVVVDALAVMAEGDSVTLFYPLDSLENVPPAFADIDVIEYDLIMEDIKDETEYEAEMNAMMQEQEAAALKLKDRLPAVSALAEETLAAYNKGALETTKTPSGLEYIIHEEGSGARPGNGDMVNVQYFGTFMDGKKFDSSFDSGRAFSFPLGQQRAIGGWDEGIAYLKEGAKASLIVPPSLGYGETGYMDIPGNTTLYFYVELEKVN
ncbi:MAG: hypothetical protein HKN87_03545 [Saprospiraceae bacterium]|nr:hypothetical protein [Saprospiraceae bacterium]